MSSEKMRELLAELDKELHSGVDFDPETRQLLNELNEELESIAGDDKASTLDRAKELESRFAATHPVAERLTRELVDALAKMGI